MENVRDIVTLPEKGNPVGYSRLSDSIQQG